MKVEENQGKTTLKPTLRQQNQFKRKIITTVCKSYSNFCGKQLFVVKSIENLIMAIFMKFL